MSEGEYLDEIYPYSEEYRNEERELLKILKNKQREVLRNVKIGYLKDRYEKANSAKVGQTIHCPYCDKAFTKKSYQHKFCCTKHKDKYWNKINPRGIYAY